MECMCSVKRLHHVRVDAARNLIEVMLCGLVHWHFVQTTWMEPEAVNLIEQSLNVNMVDLDEYPSCTDIHQRWVPTLASHTLAGILPHSGSSAGLNRVVFESSILTHVKLMLL